VARDVSTRLRADVADRARHHCEYCLIFEDDAAFPHQVDHVISKKHGGSSAADNLAYAYACIVCNRFKGSDIASIDANTGHAVRLFPSTPRRVADHFHLDGARIEPRTEIGSATIRN
jgi:hypothetical protein